MNQSDTLTLLTEKVITLREEEVFLDSDLAKMLGTTTSNLLQIVKKNKSRFPDPFCFSAKKKEVAHLIESGHLTKKKAASRSKAPLLFTESGAYMAAFLLKTEAAEKLSVNVLGTFLAKEKAA
ncbi:ORF6N domain-containing protein [Roseibacillus ishigakijimensis]|uniref:ORF6N domain-containing protein n=1 Tax=Roseibacillus ishigakijimensis TaxID=454146 RepID=A0A934VLQ2_9BACT|nr:ORF6N domain-containing protein [Roseibacillus ishigakijimensis]MBK1833477.1 ORF6N domain-containing protein [Roseibacillus ishigakijimensis]